jgi:hypothetical protein
MTCKKVKKEEEEFFLILEPSLELEILWAMGSLWCEEEGKMSSFEFLDKH